MEEVRQIEDDIYSAANSVDSIRLLSQLTTKLISTPPSIQSQLIQSTIFPILTSNKSSISTIAWASSFLATALSTHPTQLQLAINSISYLQKLLNSRSSQLEKIALQATASIYPALFKHVVTSSSTSTSTDNLLSLWTSIQNLKSTSIQLFRTGHHLGSKLSSIKLIQRIIQSQSRGTADPRLQRTAEPNLNHLKPSHPFLRPNQLEEESNKLLEEFITSLFTTGSSDVIAALVSALVGLVKLRPGMTQLVVTALVNWSPGTMERSSDAGNQKALGAQAVGAGIKSAEKAVRAGLTNLLKTSHAGTFANQINEFFSLQAVRMEEASKSLKLKKDQETIKKRQLVVDTLSSIDNNNNTNNDRNGKRRRIDNDDDFDGDVWNEVAKSLGADASLRGFDVKKLGVKIVSELVMENLRSVTEEVLGGKIEEVRKLITPVLRKGVKQLGESGRIVRGGPLDPLEADLGDEELNLKPEVPSTDNQEEEEDDDFSPQTTSTDLLQTTTSLSTLDSLTKLKLIKSALKRIGEAGLDGTGGERGIWVGLVTRLVTRGLRGEEAEEGEGEGLREELLEFAGEGDLRTRMDFARLWLNEEWYVDQFRNDEGRPYIRCLRKLLSTLIPLSTNKDKSFIPFFSGFISDLPWLPKDEIRKLGVMCTNPLQVQLGFSALHDLALLRPSVRQAALDILLELTAHPDKLTRNAAITTVKRWVPEVPPLSARVSEFSRTLFSRLSLAPPEVPKKEEGEEGEEEQEMEMEMEMEMDMDDDDDDEEVKPPVPVASTLAVVEDGVVLDGLPPPDSLEGILQHVELLFALSIKNPDLLRHVFETYPILQPFAQESILTLITPVIKSLGVACDQLTEMIGDCPPGTDVLMLKVLSILADKGRLPATHIEMIKKLARSRDDVSPRFLMLIVAECDKSEITRYVPRIVTLLNNTSAEKAAVRSMFLSIILAPSQQFGSSSNAPRTKQSEFLSPVELLTLLHTSDKEVGLKQIIEGIAICFSMPDAFRVEVFTAFMTQVVDLPVIPTLFLRTVIQAVATYKPLQPFVATTLLMRLIAREVWTTAPLWEGFVRLAKATAPNSFNALLLLPTENLRDVIAKQPTLLMPLREFVLKKTGPHRAKVEHQLEVLGGEQEEGEGEDPANPDYSDQVPAVEGMEQGGEGADGVIEPFAGEERQQQGHVIQSFDGQERQQQGHMIQVFDGQDRGQHQFQDMMMM